MAMEPAKKGATLLITAFEPFGGAKTNSSLILLEKLKAMDWGGRVVFLGPVPVSFEEAWPAVQQEMKRHPDLKGVLALGQAEGAERIHLERRAFNYIDAGIPDNKGAQPRRITVERTGHAILWSGFPWQKLEDSPLWERSYYAGAYVCNALMYHLVHWAKKDGKTAGFAHIPLLGSQKADPGLSKSSPRMDDDKALAALKRVIEFSLDSLEPKLAPQFAQNATRDKTPGSPPVLPPRPPGIGPAPG
jgi:pyroglutamyl-peptidase